MWHTHLEQVAVAQSASVLFHCIVPLLQARFFALLPAPRFLPSFLQLQLEPSPAWPWSRHPLHVTLWQAFLPSRTSAASAVFLASSACGGASDCQATFDCSVEVRRADHIDGVVAVTA